jgi:PIN domain nuclease of toxin-antitoxin system
VRTYLLDTCVFLWLITDGPGRLTSKAKRAVTSEESELLMSSVSLVEMAILAEKGRICMAKESLQRGLKSLRVSGLPFQDGDALRYFSLPENDQHRDPFDRMLIAQALEERLPVITSDRRFRGYKGLEIIW